MASFISKIATLATALLITTTAHAQTETASTVRGRVTKPGADSMVAVANQWVTLHRVGTDAAGPLDSARTSPTGSYAFTFKRTGVESAIYFVSSSYGGVAYFTSPLRENATSGDDAEITVFDTTSQHVPVSVRGHHVVINAPTPGGDRHVTEVYELSNDSSVTKVSANDGPDGATWAGILPDGARQPKVSEGDIPAAAVKFVNGRALVYAPLAPGLKQFVVSYELPPESFPLTVPVKGTTGVLEVLLEEPASSLRGAIREVEAVNVQGHRFRRFMGTDVPVNTALTVTVPDAGVALNPWFVAGLTVVIGGAMTVALARAVRRR